MGASQRRDVVVPRSFIANRSAPITPPRRYRVLLVREECIRRRVPRRAQQVRLSRSGKT